MRGQGRLDRQPRRVAPVRSFSVKTDFLAFHHARDFEHCWPKPIQHQPLSEVLPEPDCNGHCDLDDEWHEARHFWEPPYRWLAEQIGHWPIFLAVGDDEADLRNTGYPNQWRRITRWSPEGNEYVKPGQFDNTVLFSYNAMPEITFSDHSAWHIPLNSIDGEYPPKDHRAGQVNISASDRSEVLKPSYRASDWLRYAKRNPGRVQAHVSELDLSRAGRIWCRNKQTEKILVERGFDESLIEVSRLKVDNY